MTATRHVVALIVAIRIAVLALLFGPIHVLGANTLAPIDEEFFGLHIHHLDVPYREGKSSWPFVEFGSWRLQGAYVGWLDLEPRKDQWDFRRLDRYVAEAAANNVAVLLTLGKTPSWASARPNEPCGGCAAEPSSIDDWKNYVRVVARRYKGRIAAYEIWNEPRFYEMEGKISNGAVGYYSGTVSKLVEISKATREVLSAEDSTAKIVSPSFVSGDLGVRRLVYFLQAGGGKYFDVLGFHFYADTPERIPDIYRKLVTTKIKYRIETIPIWNTESGFTFERNDLGISVSKRTGSYLDVLPIATGAAYVSRSLILAASMGAARFYWFNWDGEPPHPTMGIAGVRGSKRTAITGSFQKTRSWLLGNTIEPCILRYGYIWVCKILSPGGRTSWAVWAQDTQVVADLSDLFTAGNVEYLLLNSRQAIPDMQRMPVGPEPMLLQSK